MFDSQVLASTLLSARRDGLATAFGSAFLAALGVRLALQRQ
ncbi:MAG TPA: hypothetical protein VML92_06305 [Steroidobacteraceae bacterium]|nr:hypothetical protein [Steroidobacteraceae bacterium]